MRKFALALGCLSMVMVGCNGGSDSLDKSAAPTTSSNANKPPAVNMTKTKAPPLAGPGAQQGGGGNF